MLLSNTSSTPIHSFLKFSFLPSHSLPLNVTRLARNSLCVPLDLCLTTMATSLLKPDLLRPKLKLEVGIWFGRKFNKILLCINRQHLTTLTVLVSCPPEWFFNSNYFVNETLKCDHSNESYWAVLSCGAVYYAVQGGSSF